MLFSHPASDTNKMNHETAINAVHAVFRFAWLKVVVVYKQEHITEKRNKSDEKKRGGKETQKVGVWEGCTCSDAKMKLS